MKPMTKIAFHSLETKSKSKWKLSLLLPFHKKSEKVQDLIPRLENIWTMNNKHMYIVTFQKYGMKK